MKTIFLVDDSTTLLMSMSAILEKAGFGVEKAVSGEDALKKLNAGIKPNLMITDLNMPGMDGISLIKEVKKLSQFRFMPILVMTTESQQNKRTEARSAGATGWLVKPVKPEELLGVIQQVAA